MVTDRTDKMIKDYHNHDSQDKHKLINAAADMILEETRIWLLNSHYLRKEKFYPDIANLDIDSSTNGNINLSIKCFSYDFHE